VSGCGEREVWKISTMGEMPVLTGMVKGGSKSLNGKGVRGVNGCTQDQGQLVDMLYVNTGNAGA
jgi:hypothetical protein